VLVQKSNSTGKKVLIGSVSTAAVLVAFLSYFTVGQGERAVVTRFGAVRAVAGPGINFKIPFVEGTSYMTVLDQSKVYESLDAYSKDQQPAKLKVSIQFRVPAAMVADNYAAYGEVSVIVDRLIDRRLPQEVKTVFGQFNAVSAIQNRAGLNKDAFDAVSKAIDGPVQVIGVQVENIDFSKAYEESIEARMQAEVAVQKLEQDALREKVQAQITVTKATAEADSVRARAKAQAEATRLNGDAEAAAIQARGDALRNNPSLIELTKAEKWNGVGPVSVVPNTAAMFYGAK